MHDIVNSFYTLCLFSGVEGFTTQEDQEMISRIEKQLKRRFAIGSQVSEHSIVQDFTKQVRKTDAQILMACSGFLCFSVNLSTTLIAVRCGMMWAD